MQSSGLQVVIALLVICLIAGAEVGVAAAAPAAAAAASEQPQRSTGPLKVFVLAGQSNMEGQAEVSKNCTAAEPGKCSAAGAEMNGTLTYQLSDPRTAALFAQCWDNAADNWTVLENVKIWFNEKSDVAPPTEACPLGCPVELKDGTYGDLSIGFGVGGFTSMADRRHIGPEYGFSFGEPVRRVTNRPTAAAATAGTLPAVFLSLISRVPFSLLHFHLAFRFVWRC